MVRAYITPALAAELSGQSPSDITRLIYSGALRMRLIDGHLFVSRDDLHALPFSMGGVGPEPLQSGKEKPKFTVLEPVAALSPELAKLTRDIEKRIRGLQERERKPKSTDDARFMASLLSFINAIATIALIRIPPNGGLNVAYGDGKYSGSPISSTQLRAIREAMKELGLIEVDGHFHDGSGKRKSHSTRIRPTQAFRELVNQHGIELPPLAMPMPAYAISRATDGVGDTPEEVVALDAVVRRYNEFTQQFRLTLPDNAWAELEAFMIAADKTGNTTHLHKGYDDRRIFLIRLFAETWERGGRLYGGYWQGMPKAFRAQLLIGGQPTVELDYSRLHPRMLYNREGMAFATDFDPYTVPSFNVPTEVAKETFNRLLNSHRKIEIGRAHV